MTWKATFLDGFAEATGLDLVAADGQWAGYSYQLSDWERSEIEAGGYEGGLAMGLAFRQLYPAEELDTVEGRPFAVESCGCLVYPAFRDGGETLYMGYRQPYGCRENHTA
jgi:hypothetical protein